MSIDRRRALGRSALLLAGISALAPSPFAAEVIFRPALTFGLFHSGNVFLIGYDPVSGQPAKAVGDDLAALALDLDCDRKTIDSILTFHYRPMYVAYRQQTDLDYFGNVVSLTYRKDKSRQAGFSTNVYGERTEFQGVSSYTADRPSTFVPRTTITRAHANVGGAVAVGQRSLLDWDVHGELDHYDQVVGLTLNDSNSFGARGGWRFAYSERGTIGLAVVVDRFAYQDLDSVTDESLLLTGSYSVGRKTELHYDAGATVAVSNGESNVGGEALLSITERFSETSELATGVSQHDTAGSGFQGATRDSGAWVSYHRDAPLRGLHAAADASYWYRKSLDLAGTGSGATSTFNVVGSVGWTFNRFLSIGANVAYVNQSTDSSTPSVLDADYASYGVNLRWAMRGR